jgi:hypothetical protein
MGQNLARHCREQGTHTIAGGPRAARRCLSRPSGSREQRRCGVHLLRTASTDSAIEEGADVTETVAALEALEE